MFRPILSWPGWNCTESMFLFHHLANEHLKCLLFHVCFCICWLEYWLTDWLTSISSRGPSQSGPAFSGDPSLPKRLKADPAMGTNACHQPARPKCCRRVACGLLASNCPYWPSTARSPFYGLEMGRILDTYKIPRYISEWFTGNNS